MPFQVEEILWKNIGKMVGIQMLILLISSCSSLLMMIRKWRRLQRLVLGWVHCGKSSRIVGYYLSWERQARFGRISEYFFWSFLLSPSTLFFPFYRAIDPGNWLVEKWRPNVLKSCRRSWEASKRWVRRFLRQRTNSILLLECIWLCWQCSSFCFSPFFVKQRKAKVTDDMVKSFMDGSRKIDATPTEPGSTAHLQGTQEGLLTTVSSVSSWLFESQKSLMRDEMNEKEKEYKGCCMQYTSNLDLKSTLLWSFVTSLFAIRVSIMERKP